MADVVVQAPVDLLLSSASSVPDLVHNDDEDEAASPQESDLVPTPSDDPMHFSPTSLSKSSTLQHQDIDMKDPDDDDNDSDNISVDMDIESPGPTPPIALSNGGPIIQTPPSPAPSGELAPSTKPLSSHTQQRPPTSSPAVSVTVNGFTNPDHPENSIPSPASPTAASLPAESTLLIPDEPTQASTTATTSDSQEGISLDTPMQSQSQPPLPVIAPPSPSAKHEHEDTDAMDDQRPAKRARTADIASPPPLTSSVSAPAVVPQSPVSASASSTSPTHTTLSPAQFKFAQSTLRTLRKQKDALPFNQPVDPVALAIPHYRTIITHPMDFQTIDYKLTASNPSKPDLGVPSNMRYHSAMEFHADIKLTFENCYKFNGPDHLVSMCARRLETLFVKSWKNMPPPQAPTRLVKPQSGRNAAASASAAPVASTSAALPPSPAIAVPPTPAPVPKKEKAAARRPSNAVPTIRRTDSATASEFVSARPKREIHPPPPKDSDYVEPVPKRSGSAGGSVNGSAPSGVTKVGGKRKRKDDGTLEQLRYCLKIVVELYKKQHSSYAQYFYDPVNEEYAPKYYSITKRPMDLSTLKRNLDQKAYSDANAFYEDFTLMISNCVRYNPVGTAVYIAGQDLQKTFLEKWRGLPPLHSPPPSDDEDEDEGENTTLQALEQQLAGLRDTIDLLKNKEKVKKHKAHQVQRSAVSAPAVPTAPRTSTASTSAAPKKPPTKKASSSKKNAGGGASGANRRALDADALLTFDEKKELSETIQTLEENQLDEVIRIIKEGVPEIGDTTDEIELEIDALPPNVLRQLWNTVIKPKHAPAPGAAAATTTKPFKTGRNQSHTGGTKRKSMDEAVESEKMRALEARISLFDQAVNGGPSPGANGVGANGHAPSVATVHGANDADSTDSESDSGSSSDSD